VSSSPVQNSTRDEVLARVGEMVPRFAARAAAAEEARSLPAQSARDLLDAGLARILVPARFGGYGLGFDTWFDVVREIGKADASHAWCASLIIHHPHLIGQFAEAAQREVWATGPDVAICASVHPVTQVTLQDGGYRVSGQQSAFASGVGHSAWAIVGGLVDAGAAPEWTLFLIPKDQYAVRDTWDTAGMRATGSNTIVTDNVFVPAERALPLSALREGKGPGGAVNASPIFRTPFFFYAPLAFATPLLGAAQGAYEHFREWTKTRKTPAGQSISGITSIQVRMARAAADLDAAELLLRRAAELPAMGAPLSPPLLARSVRDFTRATELVVGAIDALIALSGTAGFATSHPIQRAWRDIHFAAMHISLNAENNFAHFGRMEFGLGRDPAQPFFL